MMILLRLIHVLAGIFWVGATIFTSFFLAPSLQGDPTTMGKVMAGLAKRGFMTVMPLVAILSVLSGLTLIWVTSGGHLHEFMETASGHTFTMAGGLAMLGFLVGISVVKPTVDRAGALGAQMAAVTDPSERARLQEVMAGLQKRLKIGSTTVVILLILAASGMAIARYV